ncbi:MAG: hypothetical protein K2W95_15105 [Candidatus Obscuribacterales bacterium]|nr:hypothetical protein [Candidatus Obscuribacterales bacterium]
MHLIQLSRRLHRNFHPHGTLTRPHRAFRYSLDAAAVIEEMEKLAALRDLKVALTSGRLLKLDLILPHNAYCTSKG